MRPCLDCGRLMMGSQTRCQRCSKRRERKRNAQPKRRAYRDPAYLAVPMTGICHICLQPIDPGQGSRDHLTPISIDPHSVKALPAHRTCNSARGARIVFGGI